MKNADELFLKIDCSRGAVMTVEALKKLFTMVSQMGFTHVALYTQDTYELENEPFFGYKRGRYTKEELHELNDFAASLGMQLMPAIQVLAHMTALFHWPTYQEINDSEDMLLVGEERTYELIGKMLDTTAQTMDCKSIYICADEAYRVGRGEYLKRHGYRESKDVFLEHINRICDMAKQRGYERVLLSVDMFFRFICGTYYDNINGPETALTFPEEIRKLLPENAWVIYWDYNGETAEKFDKMFRTCLSLTDRVLFQGAGWSWCTLTPHNRRSIRSQTFALDACRQFGVRSLMTSNFGDDGGECPPHTVLPSFMHMAAQANGWDDAEMKRRFREITGEEFDDMLALDLPCMIFGEDVDISACNFSKSRLYNDPFLGILDDNANLEQSPRIWASYCKAHPEAEGKPYPAVDPKIFADYAARLHALAEESENFACFYETQACLCDALELKFDLGNRTRALYRAGDKAGLRKLAEEDYNETIRRVERFCDAFRAQWYSINKPYGFEVQELRIGGLILRLKSCRDRLLSYCDGKAEKIDELEEAVLPFAGSNFAHFWQQMATACKL